MKIVSYLLVFSNDHLRAPHKSMIDWLCDACEQTAIGTENFHLAIDRTMQNENHLKLVKIFQSIYSKVDPKLAYEFPVSRALTIEEQYAFTHALYHVCESGNLNETKKWLLDFNRLFWLGCQAIKNNDYSRFILDVMRVEKIDSNLYFLSNLIRLSARALEKDPRQLVSQIVGRLSKNTPDKEELLKSCENWLKGKPEELKCFMPPNFYLSGLDGCDTALKAIFEGHTNWINSICISNDGKTLFTCSDDFTTRSWNVETGKQIEFFEGHVSKVNSICLSNDQKTLFTCSYDKTARSWNVETGHQIRVFEGHTDVILSISLSNDGKTLFTCSEDKTARSWNVETGQQIHVFEGHTSSVESICLSKDGNTLFTCSYDETARSWNVETGKQIRVFEGHTSYVSSSCLSNDGKTLFTCSADKTARSWNLETGKQMHVFEGHTSFVNSICVSNDGKTLCTAGDDQVRYWDIVTRKEIKTTVISKDEHKIPVNNIDSSSNTIGSTIHMRTEQELYQSQDNLYGFYVNKVILWRIWNPLSDSFVLDRSSY